MINKNLSTADVAHLAGVHKDTLLRWLRSGLVNEPSRDRNGWRIFTPQEVQKIISFARSASYEKEQMEVTVANENRTPYLGSLSSIDWNFTGAKTSYLTHGIHPYPAKFIPQIPNALIQELSCVGDTVADIFCGSGTTVVEALTLKRHAIGIDANPLACLISRAKTSFITEAEESELRELSAKSRNAGEEIAIEMNMKESGTSLFISKEWRPSFEKLHFWFEDHVIEELAEILSWCRKIPCGPVQDLALASFSSIIVTVSKQDSDTRYVRREKNIGFGEVFRRFSRALEQSVKAAMEFSDIVEPRFRREIIAASLLDTPDTTKFDLVVCSPPYPNAYSYHLYHMTRMLWLDMDQPRFKKEEIGSHRKYSNNGKNRATAETFEIEFSTILRWLSGRLKKDGYACFVVGDSTLKGERINNADIISRAGLSAGFREVSRLERVIQATKKAFNPSIGKIKTEKILILENKGDML